MIVDEEGNSVRGYSSLLWRDNGHVTEHLGAPNRSLSKEDIVAIRAAVTKFCEKFKAKFSPMGNKETSEDDLLDKQASVRFFFALILCLMLCLTLPFALLVHVHSLFRHY
jgi:hypothetical protein